MRSVSKGSERVTAEESSEMKGPVAETLRSALTTLHEGRVSEVVEQFADRFTFNDHALRLEFTDKMRLTEFFERSRELFADATVEMGSVFESGEQAIAAWMMAATEPVALGPTSYRVPISLQGSTIICVENGRIVR